MLDELTTVLAVRHGQTDWNVEQRVQGQLDVPLNEQGRLQVARLAARFAQGELESLDALYSSDLTRARDTATAIGEALGLPVREEAGLRERHWGAFQGHTWADIAARWPHLNQRWRERDAAFAAPEGGESWLAFAQRATAAAQALAQRHAGQRIALITHGGVLDVLYRAATGQGLQAPRHWVLDNTAVNRLSWTREGWQLVGWQDTRHLDDRPV